MNARTLTYLMVLAFLAMMVLLVGNAVNLFQTPRIDAHISPYDVRGMAIFHKATPYTLNFTQENECVSALNRGIPIGTLRKNQNESLPFEKLVIYRFKQPDIALQLADFSDLSLIFQVKDWNPDGYIVEVSGGDMWSTLSKAFGP